MNQIFKNVDGIIVPGGFGVKDIKGEMNAIKYARENNIPFFGICLGMQLACIEFAQNVCNISDANSKEFDEQTKNPIIDLMLETKKINQLNSTLRLGNYPCTIIKNTKAHEYYKKVNIQERHRHRYEFNNKYINLFEQKGMIFSGMNNEKKLVEIIELENHKCFIGCQFHPEFKSRPTKPHPLFEFFIKTSIENKCKEKNVI